MDLLKRWFRYLYRAELDLHHVLVNVVFSALFLVQLLAFVMALIMVEHSRGLLISFVGLVGTLLFMYLVNKFKRSDLLLCIFCLCTNLIYLPILYVNHGGFSTGTVVRMLFGLLITLFLCNKGPVAWISFAVSMITDICLILVQLQYPDLINVSVNPFSRMMDDIQSFIFVALILGVSFRILVNKYDHRMFDIKAKDCELEDANKLLVKANHAKSDFLVKMSHEIRTPINAIIGMDEMILRETKEENTLTYASSIDGAGRTLLALVNDILDLSQISSGKPVLQEKDYEIYPLLIDCYNLIWSSVQEKKLKLVFENNPELPSVLVGDSIRVKQCIMNLLSNAVKYTAHGCVTLKLDYDNISGGRVMLRIAVTDTGAGIAPEDMETLFETKAWHGDEPIGIAGSGIGLPLTKEIVEFMGGKITAQSSRGIGSTFMLEIPQKVSSTEAMGYFSERYADYSGTSSKYSASFTAPSASILVVDDVRMNLNVFSALLKHTLIKPETAMSGEEALALISKNHYDVIFLDHMMPGLDGVETLDRIRSMKDSPNANTPIIVLTANAIIGAKDRYLSLGFTDYIAKPVRSYELERLLIKYLPSELVRSCEAADPEAHVHSVVPAPNMGYGDPYAKWISANMPFLNVAAGIANCGDSSEVLLKVLEELVSQTVTEDICKAYSMSDLKNYAIFAHSIKTSLRVIGYDAMADRAYALEKASKAMDMDAVRQQHDAFMKDFRELLDIVSEKLASKPFTGSEDD